VKPGVAGTAALVAVLSSAAAVSWTAAAEDRVISDRRGAISGQRGAISDRRAIELARRACEGKVTVPAEVEPVVTRAGGTIVVTFPTRLAPGARGADYYAHVTLDAESGRVVEVLGGS
jgi:hypothetical protein